MDSGDAMLRAVLNYDGIAMLPTYITTGHIRSSALVTLSSRHAIPKIRRFWNYYDHFTEIHHIGTQ
jgi:DNA-binding transcriptional LysR family regulator